MIRLWRRWEDWRDSSRGQAIHGWSLLSIGLAGLVAEIALSFNGVNVHGQYWLMAGVVIVVGLVLLKRSVDPR